MYRFLFVAAALLASSSVAAQPALLAPASVNEASLTPRQAEILRLMRAEPHMKEVQIVVANASLLDGATAVSVTLPDGNLVAIASAGIERRSDKDLSWSGRSDASRGAPVIRTEAAFVIRNGWVTGSIRSGGGVYTLRPLTGGLHAIGRVDTGSMRDHDDDYPAFEQAEHARVEQARASGVPDVTVASRAGAIETVDVLVVYTAALAAAQADPHAFAQLAIDTANNSYIASNIDVRVALASAYETPTVESATHTMGPDLDAIMTMGDGRFDEAHAKRAAYGADVVSLIGVGYTDSCGLAYFNVGDALAFSLSDMGCAVDNLSFPHEIGHNFGSDHDPDAPAANGAFAYGHGYLDIPGQWRTIMAYDTGCSGCQRVGYWSSPLVTYTDTTAPIHTGVTGDAAVRDNRRVHVERAATMAAIRARPAAASFTVPAGISATLAPGATSSQMLTIQNAAAPGASPLDWFVSVAASGPGAADECAANTVLTQGVDPIFATTTAGTNEFGQSFTAPCTGVLVNVAPAIYYGGAPNAVWTATLRLYAGAGTGGTLLSSSSVSKTNSDSGQEYVEMPPATTVAVTKNSVYTWFLDMETSSTAILYSNANPYAGGALYSTANGDPANAMAAGANDMAFQATFNPESRWLTATPTFGYTDAATSTSVSLAISAVGLTEGTYPLNIVVKTNDPGNAMVNVPATLTVTGSNVAAGQAGWRFLAPAASGMTVDDFAAINLVQGVPGYYPPPEAMPNLYSGYDGTAYTPSTGSGEALAPGQGFFWFLYNVDLVPGGASNSHVLPMTLTSAKPAVTTDTPVTLHAAGDKFNMLGNPFGVSLKVDGISGWPGVGNLSSNVAQMWTPTGSVGAGTFETSVTRPTISAWQGFFVEASAAGSLTIPESARTTGGVLSRSASTEALIAFELADATGDHIDRAAVITFGEGRDAGQDLGDATKLEPISSEHVLLAFKADGTQRAVESRPLEPTTVSMAVSSVGAGSDLVLTWPRMEGLPEGWTASLRDLATGQVVDLSQTDRYAFSTESRAARSSVTAPVAARAAALPARFDLVVGPRSVANEGGADAVFALDSPRPNPATQQTRLGFSLAKAGAVRLSVIDVQGREVAVLLDEDRNEGTGYALFDASGLASGVYVVRLDAGGDRLTRRLVVAR